MTSPSSPNPAASAGTLARQMWRTRPTRMELLSAAIIVLTISLITGIPVAVVGLIVAVAGLALTVQIARAALRNGGGRDAC